MALFGVLNLIVGLFVLGLVLLQVSLVDRPMDVVCQIPVVTEDVVSPSPEASVEPIVSPSVAPRPRVVVPSATPVGVEVTQ